MLARHALLVNPLYRNDMRAGLGMHVPTSILALASVAGATPAEASSVSAYPAMPSLYQRSNRLWE